MPERALERGRIRRVDLEGTQGDALHGLDGRIEKRGLVESGDAAVHIEDPRTRIDLLHGFAENVRRIAPRVRLLEMFLPGRVDPLADDEALMGFQFDDRRTGGDQGQGIRDRGTGIRTAFSPLIPDT